MRILFYYNGFANTTQNCAGTAMMVRSMAVEIAKKYDVTISGDFVRETETLGKALIVPLPKEEFISDFCLCFDIVIFCNSFMPVVGMKKSKYQAWILYHHCWGMHPTEAQESGQYNRIVALSGLHRENLLKLKVKPGVSVVSNFVDSGYIKPVPSKREENWILYAGQLAQHKNVDMLLDAYALLRRHSPKVQLHVCGEAHFSMQNDAYISKIMRDMQRNGVVYHGLVDNADMSVMYSKASVLCLPSTVESFGLVTIEAQTCGCIPVISNRCGMPVTVNDGVTGFLFNPDSYYILSNALSHALQRAKAKPQMRDDAKKFVAERFSKEKSVAEFIKVIEGVS